MSAGKRRWKGEEWSSVPHVVEGSRIEERPLDSMCVGH